MKSTKILLFCGVVQPAPVISNGLLAVTLTLLLSASGSLQAKIYKTVDAQGNVSYTDVAPAQRESEAELQVEELNTFTSPEPAPEPLPTVVLNNPDNDEDEEDQAPNQYSQIRISSPGDDEAVRANSGDITLYAGVEPELHNSHRLRFYIDGSPVGTVDALSFSLSNMDRGTHQAKVAVVDASGTTIGESSTVTFHVLRAFRPPQSRSAPRRSGG